MRAFLIRHGKTLGNLRRAFVGSIDQPLSLEGRRELAAAGAYPPAQQILASPMKRCVETAGILYPGRKIVLVEGLRERCFGEFEGRTHDEIIALPGYANWGMNPESMDFPGGEEPEPFFARCIAAFTEQMNRCGQEGVETVAVICHGGVIMALMERLCVPRKTYFDWQCGNGCGYVVNWDGTELTLQGRLGGCGQ